MTSPTIEQVVTTKPLSNPSSSLSRSVTCTIQILVWFVASAAGFPQQPANLRNHYETAQRLEQQGKWAEAEKAWRDALRLDPKDAHAWTNLGVVLNRQLKSDEAANAWNQALAIDSNLAGPNINLGILLVQKASFADAITPLRRALISEPNHEGARRALALAYIGTNEFQLASREIAQLLARSPKDAALLELAAQSFVRQRRYKEAEIVLARRLKLENVTAAHWAAYGDVLDALSRTPEATDVYKKAVDLDPNSTVIRYGLAYLQWKLFEYDDAERELKEVLRRNPDDARASYTLGDLYLAKGFAARAIPLLRKAVAGYPNEFDTHFALGRALILTGSLDDGIEELRTAVRLDDTIADAHYQLGRALMRVGSTMEGKRELERSRVLNDRQRDKEAERHKKKLP